MSQSNADDRNIVGKVNVSERLSRLPESITPENSSVFLFLTPLKHFAFTRKLICGVEPNLRSAIIQYSNNAYRSAACLYSTEHPHSLFVNQGFIPRCRPIILEIPRLGSYSSCLYSVLVGQILVSKGTTNIQSARTVYTTNSKTTVAIRCEDQLQAPTRNIARFVL